FPYAVEGGPADVLSNIQHAEPTRLRTVNRGVDDELETITLKSLQKDPERRYQSAGDLADDVRRYLAGEPLAAKRDALPYIIRKPLRRHRGTLAIVAGFLILLVASSVVSMALWRQAAAQRDVAVFAEHRARAERDRAITAERTAQARRAEAETMSGMLESLLA